MVRKVKMQLRRVVIRERKNPFCEEEEGKCLSQTRLQGIVKDLFLSLSVFAFLIVRLIAYSYLDGFLILTFCVLKFACRCSIVKTLVVLFADSVLSC